MNVDLLERGPRLRRFFVSLAVAIAVAIITMLVCLEYIGDDTPGDWRYGASQATWYFTGLAAAAGYTVTYILLLRRDRRRDFPSARLESE